MMRLALLTAAALFAFPAFAADATTPVPPAAPPSCDTPEHHQMDFWVGTWKLTWQGGSGTNRVTKEYNGCVIHEVFTQDKISPPPLLNGSSLSSYQPMNMMWRQTWVDDQNGYLHLSGGPQADGTFRLQTVRMGREPHMTRMIFEDITHDSLTWRWQQSDDGDVWTDTWVIHYRRIN